MKKQTVFTCPECSNTYPDIEYDFAESEGTYYDIMKCLKYGHVWDDFMNKLHLNKDVDRLLAYWEAERDGKANLQID